MIKTVTLYPGRYAYICPCGHPYQVMTLYRKTSNVAVYCFACKQQTGKHIRIMDQNIDFAVNSNNKLNGTYFTALRLHDPIRYCVGNVLTVSVKQQPRGKAKIIKVNSFTIDKVNDYISCLDSGLKADEYKTIIKKTYSGNGINWDKQLLDFCLFEQIDKR